jgi:RNA polymerase sigma factor (sigma-70 family)
MYAVLDYLRKFSGRGQSGGLSDGQLVERFVTQRDETAFEILFQRHAPLVLHVCRGILRHPQDAEDAFQATFLVLVRKAQAISRRESVASWLYGVAFRIAVRAKAEILRRGGQEIERVEMIPAPSAPVGDDPEVRMLVHEEVDRLPEKYRLPVLLCYLNGKTREEAARELGWTPGAVKGRLERARELLRGRLIRRGLPCSVGSLAVMLSADGALGTVPAGLVAATRQAAWWYARGNAEAAGLISARTSALAEGMVRSMFWTKVKTTMGVLLALAVAGAGAGLLMYPMLPAGSGIQSEPVTRQAPAKTPLADPVQTAIAKGAEYLKSIEREGSWDHHYPGGGYPGGLTSLALLALLESGVKADDPVAAKGLAFLRTVQAKETYVLVLQTLVLCRVKSEIDRAIIQRNVDALVRSRKRDDKGRLTGWTYRSTVTPQTDNSNTHYAVMGLHTGARAGAKIDETIWQEIQEYYLRNQEADGGWSYGNASSGKSTLSMTAAGVSGLVITRRYVRDPVKGFEEALGRGLDRLGEIFLIDGKVHAFTDLYGIRRAGQLSGMRVWVDKRKMKNHDWYQEGSELLLREQMADGAWKFPGTIASHPAIATSFALLFLAKE